MSSGVRIAVPIAEPSVTEAVASAKQSEPFADIIEFRLDYLSSVHSADLPKILGQLASAVEKPVIFTFRPEHEGGRATADRGARRTFWLKAINALEKLERSVDRLYCDIEVDLVEVLAGEQRPVPWQQVIVSHHRFERTPDDLSSIYDRLKATPARILKIVTFAHDLGDSLSIFRLLDVARREGKELIAIAMGMAGVITRVLGPAHGSFLTFGASGEGAETAPGQIPAADLRDLYRVERISAETPVMGVIGNPVGHSLSPRLHNSWFKLCGLDAVYVPFEVRNLGEFMTKFVNARSRLFSWNLRGLSVTVPHKIEVMRHLDVVDPLAREIGAVNTIVIEDGRLFGYNTDVVGLIKPLEKRVALKHSRVAVIGTGGAARATAFGLKARDAQITIIGRSLEKARRLAEEVQGEARLFSDLDSVKCDVLINATPAGMKGYADEYSVPLECLRQKPLVYDLVYHPIETKLLRHALALGCETLGGVEMFVIQAAEQFRLWTGSDPPLDAGYRLVYTWAT